MTRKHKERGALLVSVLLVTLLLNIMVGLLFYSFLNQKELALANLHQLRKLSEAAAWKAENSKLPNLANRERFVSTNDKANQLDLVYSNKRGQWTSPNWQELEKMEQSNCNNTESNLSSSYKSIHTCSNPSRVSAYIKGNLKSSKEITLKDDTFFINGYLQVKKLTLASPTKRISIFAISDIEIDFLEINNLKIEEILLHSSKGRVKIRSATNNFKLCNQNESSEGNFKTIYLYSPKTKQYTTARKDSPGWMNCEPELSGRLWPSSTLVYNSSL